MNDLNNDEESLENEFEVNPTEDPFDLSRLRLSQDYGLEHGVERILINVKVRKPTKQEFFRVHPDKDYQFEVLLIEDEQNKEEVYLVDKPLSKPLAEFYKRKNLYTCLNKNGDVFLWPVKLHDINGNLDGWNRSAQVAAEIAQKKWVRLTRNHSAAVYGVNSPTADYGEPEWGDESFQELLKIAFKERFIRDLDHPVVKKLRGEI